MLLDFAAKAKEAYSKGDLKTAGEYWTKIYNTCSSSDITDARDLALTMRKFTDQEVYDITDYLKETSGYYG
jgi:hypothetical protein